MYAHTTSAHSATVRQALQRASAHTEGLSSDGKYGWLARDGTVLVWQVSDGSYAAVRSLACSGRMQQVHVFDNAASGTVTVVATQGCDVFTWLDAAVAAPPIQTRATNEPIALFTARPLDSADGAGFVAAASTSGGGMAVLLSGQGRVVTRSLNGAAFAAAPRGYMQAFGTVVKKREGPAWMAKMARGSAGYSWLESTVSRLTALQPRGSAPHAPAIDSHLVQTGPAAWRAFTLTTETITCWHIDATAASSIGCQCTWSLDVAPALARFSNSRDVVAVRMAVRGAALCLLCARRLSSGGRRLALAFLQLPAVASGEVPEPHFYAELGQDCADAALAQPWCLALRPDVEHIVTSGSREYTVFIVAPDDGGGVQNIVWQHGRAAAAVLPEVRDAAAVLWSGAHGSWQLLSPVFGVLLVRESGGTQQTLPVAPLLEAAVARQLDGEGMPGLASALQHTHALQSAADGSNPVERFSHAIVNTLAKAYAAERARTNLTRALQLKQQRHTALLESLFAAGALPDSYGKDGVSPLPSEAAFKIMEHAEHIAAMIAVHTHLAAMLADVQQAEATQAALEAALQSIAAPPELPVSAEEWLFSSPTEHCGALARGIAQAAAQTGLPLEELEALARLLCALLRGARACRSSLAERRRAGFQATQRCACIGWLACRSLRDAISTVVAVCLQRVKPLRSKWSPLLMELMHLLLARC